MKKISSFVLALIVSAGLMGLAPTTITSANAIPSIDGAFEDLGRCLQSQGKNKVLDVFYLIDESGSFEFAATSII